MTDENDKIRDLGTLREMMAKGQNYREEFELEMFGSPVVFVLKPIPDEQYIPLQVYMKEVLGMDDEEAMERIEEAREEDEDGTAKMENIRVEDPEEFAKVLKQIAILSIDYEKMDGDEEDVKALFEGAVGGYTPEIAYKGMEVTGNLRDAKKFRGGRGGN